MPNTSTPLLKTQSLILNGVSTFNNEIRVPTIAGLTSTPIKVTSAVDFNKLIKFNDTIRVETGKIDPGKAEQAANKNYVDTQISTISQFDSSSDQTISGTWKFSKPLKITEAQLTDEAVSKGYADETIQQNLNTTLEGVIKFVSMTEAEYKALETKSPSTIYHLTDVSMWTIGDQEIVTSNMPA